MRYLVDQAADIIVLQHLGPKELMSVGGDNINEEARISRLMSRIDGALRGRLCHLDMEQEHRAIHDAELLHGVEALEKPARV